MRGIQKKTLSEKGSLGLRSGLTYLCFFEVSTFAFITNCISIFSKT